MAETLEQMRNLIYHPFLPIGLKFSLIRMIKKQSHVNDPDQIILAKNNRYLLQLASSLCVIQPELSRSIMKKFNDEEKCFESETKEQSERICKRCFSVFIPIVNCIVTESKRTKLKLGEHNFDWSLKNNKNIKFINYATKKSETVIVKSFYFTI